MGMELKEIIKPYEGAGRESLIPLLQNIQENQGYLSKEAVSMAAETLQLPASKIYGVATFYNQFRFEPTGKYHILVCRGPACHVLGSATVLEKLEKELKCKAGQTTRDGLFSIEVVACIGACGLAPVININGTFHAKVTELSIVEIINTYRNRENTEEE